MMAIEMVGGVYCPLSPRDPRHRLQSLVEQTQSRLVLIHWLTKEKLKDDSIIILNMDVILLNSDYSPNHMKFRSLSDLIVSPEHIAYIIFTSGSTGTPKAVSDSFSREFYCIVYPL